MSNSRLVDMTMLSPNHSGRRNQPITKIAIHHTAGAISAATIGNILALHQGKLPAIMESEMITKSFYV